MTSSRMTLPEQSKQITGLLGYWRASLADEDIIGGDDDRTPLGVAPGAISALGEIDQDLARKLRRKWEDVSKAPFDRTSIGSEKGPDFGTVPVVLLRKGLSPTVSHGAVTGGRKLEPKFALVVPALLTGPGKLTPDSDRSPWIRREFLSPVARDGEDIPVVGALHDFDRWLERNPPTSSGWAELTGWCDAMWSAVTHGIVPEGFSKADGERISVAVNGRGAGQHILKLYDALLEAPDRPALLRTACLGATASELDRAGRLERMGAARGSMGSVHGLTASQADAAAAATRLVEGSVLAINGPPGTGKTTLLQSVIAAEAVRRAVEGGEPAIVVGCSTNKQAVTNINRAMNSAVAQDRSGEVVPWGRRWVPDIATYGLYLASRQEGEAGKAEKDGFAVAIREGNKWRGLPEQTEANPDYIARATAEWKKRFEETYGTRGIELSEAIDHVQADLRQLLAQAGRIAETVQRWDKAKAWWRDQGDAAPDKAAEADRKVSSAKAALSAWERELETAHEARRAVVAQARAACEAARLRAEEIAGNLAAAIQLGLRIAMADEPHGVLERLAGVLPFLRGPAQMRQHARRIGALRPEEQVLFAAEMPNQDPQAWTCRTERMVADLQASLDRARSMQAHAEAAVGNAEAAQTRARVQAEQAAAAVRKEIERAQAERSREMDQLNRRRTELLTARQNVRDAYEALRLRRPTGPYRDEKADAEHPDWLAIMDRTLDVTLRHEMFHKAMRYWEGRWIIEADRLDKQPGALGKKGRGAVLARLRRWCKLTPCLVATLHALPGRMTFTPRPKVDEGGQRVFTSDFLLGEIDLLIVDEAGQVGPHVGMAAFSLAKRAVVVGDVHQLEPITKIPAGTDRANAFKLGLHDQWTEDGPQTPHFLGESLDGLLGSVMRVAQYATAFTAPGAGREPGVFLSEHRRCDPAIIAYNNEVFYAGRLQPLTAPRAKAPEMRAWGWGHVRGQCERRGGSWANPKEAMAIADWIAKRADGEHGWLAAYQRRDPKRYDRIEKVVAVLTPFAAQVNEIQRALGQKGPRFRNITVGTVNTLQGAERPVVVFSPTYADGPDLPSTLLFDLKPNLLNVAVSRAEDSFVVIGDMRIFRRADSRSASARLHGFFHQPENELGDVEGNYGFSDRTLREARRLSGLEEHREALASAFKGLGRGELLTVVSPYVTLFAVQSDDVVELCRAAASRGGQVHIVADKGGIGRSNPEQRANEALAALRGAGATVHLATNVHSKTLIVADRQIAEGSFNWLSAMRDRTNRFLNHEASYVVSGASAKADILRALQELNERGAALPIPPVLTSRPSSATKASRTGPTRRAENYETCRPPE